MRTRTVLLVSLGTVMAAGSASAAVSGSSPSGPRVVAQAPAPGASDTTTPASSSSTPATVTTPAAGSAVIGSIEPGDPARQRFVVGDAATVIVDTSTGMLQVVVVAPHPGWTIARLERRDGGELEIRFESPNAEVRFDASIAAGTVVAMLDDVADPPTTIGSGSSPAVTTPGSGPAVTTPGTGSTLITVDDGGGNRGSGGDDRGGNSGQGNGGDERSGSGGGNSGRSGGD